MHGWQSVSDLSELDPQRRPHLTLNTSSLYIIMLFAKKKPTDQMSSAVTINIRWLTTHASVADLISNIISAAAEFKRRHEPYAHHELLLLVNHKKMLYFHLNLPI